MADKEFFRSLIKKFSSLSDEKNQRGMANPPLRKKLIQASLLLAAGIGSVFLVTTFLANKEKQEMESLSQALAIQTIQLANGSNQNTALSEDSPMVLLSIGISRLAILDTIIPNRPRDDILTYSVQQGDSLFQIAERYGLKPESILWFNLEVLDDNPNLLKPGLILNIPPVDGVPHIYKSGENLDEIAREDSYSTQTSAQAIIEWPGNDLDPYETDPNNPNIPDGTLLVVPNGSRLLKDWGPPAVTRANAASAASYGSGSCGSIYEGAIGYGSFVWPTVATYLSGFDFNPPVHNGLDIAGAEGNAIYAADSGVVVYSGWSDHGFGNLLVIDHGNGWQTAYAHLSTISVGCGQSVSQGEVVAAVGNSGNSTGAHLHFELNLSGFGKVSPWDYLSP